MAYLIFWGPLFLVTLFNYGWELQEVKIYISNTVTLLFALQICNKVFRFPFVVKVQAFIKKNFEIHKN